MPAIPASLDVKIGLLRSRAARLDARTRKRMRGVLERIDEARIALELRALSLTAAPRNLVASVVDEVSSAAEVLDAAVGAALRSISPVPARRPALVRQA